MYRDRYPKERIMWGLKVDYIFDRYIKGLLPQYCRIYWTRKRIRNGSWAYIGFTVLIRNIASAQEHKNYINLHKRNPKP